MLSLGAKHLGEGSQRCQRAVHPAILQCRRSGRSAICGKLLEVPPVGPWRSWERASMASRRSWVRIPSAPPIQSVSGPETRVTDCTGYIGDNVGPKGCVLEFSRPQSKATQAAQNLSLYLKCFIGNDLEFLFSVTRVTFFRPVE